MTRLLPILLIGLTTGCDTGNWETEPFMGGYYEGEGSITDGRIAADQMPHVGTFEDTSRQGWFYKYDNWVDLSLDSYGDYGWAMLIVSGEGTEDGYHDVIGCTGDEDGYAEYDEPAEESEVTFSDIMIDGEYFTQVRITATFADGSTADAMGQIAR